MLDDSQRREGAVLENGESEGEAMRVLAIEIKFLCPTCSSKLRTEVQYAGTRTACAVCGRMLTVPSPFVVPLGQRESSEAKGDSDGRAGASVSVLTADEVAFLTGEV